MRIEITREDLKRMIVNGDINEKTKLLENPNPNEKFLYKKRFLYEEMIDYIHIELEIDKDVYFINSDTLNNEKEIDIIEADIKMLRHINFLIDEDNEYTKSFKNKIRKDNLETLPNTMRNKILKINFNFEIITDMKEIKNFMDNDKREYSNIYNMFK